MLNLFTMEPYWRVVLTTGRKISGIEKHRVSFAESLAHPEWGRERSIDWTLDLLSTGDLLKIKELHLVYPGLFRHACLEITEPRTAFQFRRQAKGMDMGTGQVLDSVEAQIIGRVYDKENGLCQGYIWDRVKGLIQYDEVEINNFPSWRSGLMPPGVLNLDVLGVRL
jgi:hypothetical protein